MLSFVESWCVQKYYKDVLLVPACAKETENPRNQGNERNIVYPSTTYQLRSVKANFTIFPIGYKCTMAVPDTKRKLEIPGTHFQRSI